MKVVCDGAVRVGGVGAVVLWFLLLRCVWLWYVLCAF